MQTNQEIYWNIVMIAQAKGLESGLVFYATKNEEGITHVGLSRAFNFADEFTEKNIQEMNEISLQDDFAFWLESDEGKQFFNEFLYVFMENIKEAEQNGII